MALNIGDNFSYLGAKPLDNREVYATKAALLAVNLSTVYEGMVAYVKGEDKYYRLKGTTWVEFSSGSGGGISNWTANTAYVVDDVVINSSKLYICTTAHTSGSSFDATEQANWSEVGSGGAGISSWVTNKGYAVGDIVYYADSIYKCNTAHTSSTFSADSSNWDLMFSDLKTWTDNTYYSDDTIVISGNKIYKCTTAHTSGSTFDSTEETNWQELGSSSGAGITIWATSTDYELGDIVIYANSLYRCNTSHTSSTFSTDIGNWDLIFADLKIWRASTYYYTGTVVINDNNIYKCTISHTSGSTFNATEEANWQKLGDKRITTWTTATDYEVGDIIIYAGSLYKCITIHTSNVFSTDISYWNLVYADIKPWVSGDYYSIGTCVVDSDRYIWRCTTAHTAGLAFDPTEQANWEMIGGDPDSLTSAQIAALIANFNPAGNGLMQLDNWEASHGYTVKQVVLYNNKMYRCKTAHTSGTTFDATEQANWDEIVGSGGGASISAWTSGGNYSVGDFVIYHNKIYQCKTANADTTFTPANWQEIGGIADYASGVSYMVGELVFNGTKLCRCKVAHTSTATFDDTKWDIIAGTRTNIEAWASSTKYSVGEVVVRENNIYRCKTAHTSSSAFSTDIANWTKLDNIPDWASSKAYFVDDLVIYSNNVYKCVTAHTSASTFDKSKWQILGMTVTAPIKVGEVGFVSWQYALMTDNLALDGSTINNFSANYPELYNFFNTNGVLTTTLATYTANKALCYYDSTNDAATMPDFLDKTVWGGTTITEKSAGLPNITGTFSVNPRINGNSNSLAVNNRNVSGAFYNTNDSSTYQSVNTVAGNAGSGVLNLDASRSSSIYGNSTTVQPPAIQLIPQIRYRKEVVEGSFEEYGNSPIGTIISYMGNTPPVEYLACDGTAYNIVDYWELAEFIKAEFGSYNYFGGDGTTTFAVPDLRGEFLRGSGTNSHASQGSGASVGSHQNATTVPTMYTTGNAPDGFGMWTTGTGTQMLVNNADGGSATAHYAYIALDGKGAQAETTGLKNVRPTNTSVLYCIKYTNSLIMQPANNYSTTEKRIGTWIDGKPLYQKTVVFSDSFACNPDTYYTADKNINDLNIDTFVRNYTTFDHNGTTQDAPFMVYTASGAQIVTASCSHVIVSGDDYLRFSYYRKTGSSAVSNIIVTVQYTKS